MGLKLGDFSPLAGAISGEGMFGTFARDLGIKYADDALAKKKAEDEKADIDRKIQAGVLKNPQGVKRGGTIKKMAKGGKVSSASKRGDGCATKGKTKGRFV